MSLSLLESAKISRERETKEKVITGRCLLEYGCSAAGVCVCRGRAAELLETSGDLVNPDQIAPQFYVGVLSGASCLSRIATDREQRFPRVSTWLSHTSSLRTKTRFANSALVCLVLGLYCLACQGREQRK